MTLSDKLEKLLALSKAASPGPWQADGDAIWWTEEVGYGCEWVDIPKLGRLLIPGPDTGSGRCEASDTAKALVAWRTWIEPLVAVAEAAANPDLKLGNEELDGAESIRWYAASKALTHALAALDSLEVK